MNPRAEPDQEVHQMHTVLESAADRLSISLDGVRAAAEASRQVCADATTIAVGYLVEAGVIEGEGGNLELGLVAFGSLARDEASKLESDFDYAVVAYHTVETPEHIQQYQRAADLVCKKTGLKPPGVSRVFGGLISGTELINKIGLDDDTNRSHTQRMLFLEESTPIVGVEQHRNTLRAILRRYLVDYREEGLQKAGVPRFLVNDVVRYWRTIAVDYQAKRWDEPTAFAWDDEDIGRSPKWGMRYIKLRSSRKLAFCGTLVAMLIPHLTNRFVDDELLVDQFSMPSLARIAQLAEYVEHADDREALCSVLQSADWFARKFDDGEFRRAVDGVEHPRRSQNPAFREAFEKTEELQRALEALFLSSNPLVVPDGIISVRGSKNGALCLRQLTARYFLF